MHKFDYALYIVKPDGVKIGIQEIIHAQVAKNGYRIEAEKRFLLQPERLSNLFNTGFNKLEYNEYMTSSSVIVGICSGVNAFEWLTSLKYSIRREFGKQNDMFNLLHTCEPGWEQLRQMDFFFPEWHRYGWGPTADMYIPIGCNDHLKKIEYVVSETNLEYAGFVLTERIDRWEEPAIQGVNPFYGVQIVAQHISQIIPLMLYFRHCEQAMQALELNNCFIDDIVSYVKNRHGIAVVGFFPYNSFTHELLSRVEGIDGVYLFDPIYTFDELNVIEHWTVVNNKMTAIGGSHGLAPIGEFGIPASYVAHILDKTARCKFETP